VRTILIADVPSMDARYAAVFAGSRVLHVRTMSEAHTVLETQRCDLVVVGVYFDDSRMFDLVRVIRNDEIHNEVPIVCVRGSPGFTAVTTRTLEMAVKALSADAFVDLLHFDDEPAGDAALREATLQFLEL
jgi:response regulator of citrate/malate metabolism